MCFDTLPSPMTEKQETFSRICVQSKYVLKKVTSLKVQYFFLKWRGLRITVFVSADWIICVGWDVFSRTYCFVCCVVIHSDVIGTHHVTYTVQTSGMTTTLKKLKLIDSLVSML